MSDTALVRTGSLALAPRSIAEMKSLAEELANTDAAGMLPTALRGKPGQVFVILMTGIELGLGPMQSLRGINVIQGKGVPGTDLIVGLVKKSPTCVYFRCIESTDKQAVYETLRTNSEPVRLAFTIEQAKKANLLGKDNWKNYPEAMLRARCAAALARMEYPDIAQGLYDADEIPSEEPTYVAPSRKPPVRAEVPAPQAEVIDAVHEESVLEKYSREMDAAKTEEELQNIGPRIKKDPDAQQYRKELAAKYSACMNALKGAA